MPEETKNGALPVDPDLGREIANALSVGLSSLCWARRPEQAPVYNTEAGLYEDHYVVDALVRAIGAIPGVRAIN
jgi:hypothetical protein